MDPELVKSSIEEILSVDIMLGLVGDMTQYNSSLVQSLDVTKRGPENLRRDISSTASNIMTVLVKGDPCTRSPMRLCDVSTITWRWMVPM
jgi:hypothetical protein